jgi:predicted secreted hydrolase
MRHFFFALIVVMCAGISSQAVAEPSGVLASAQPGYSWSFPADHGAHESFETEWWYFTGQLFVDGDTPFRDAARYGFQLTFFRRSTIVNGAITSDLLAHAALTDIREGKTYLATRQGGALLGMAGVRTNGLDVWSGEWIAVAQDKGLQLRFDLPGGERPLRVSLHVEDFSAVWLQGDRGYSRKGACATCASNYYSIPRLNLGGEVVDDEGTHAVRGLGWMDHEFMTNTLDADQVGWDWMGLMFRDGRELMVFRLRDARGGTSYMSGTLRLGSVERMLSRDDFSIEPVGEGVKVASGARYPLAWRVRVPKHNVDTVVRARVPQCEIGESASALAPRYWEGPVASADESALGYLEMTGYAGKVQL